MQARPTEGATPGTTPLVTPGGDTLPPSMYALLAALTLIWGFNWTVIKVVITEVPPWFFRSLCFLSAFFGLLAVARARSLPMRPRGASEWRRIAAVALCTVSLQNIFLMLAIPLLSSGRVVILLYTMPAWSVLLARGVLGEAFTARRLTGAALGVAGVGVLLAKDVRVWAAGGTLPDDAALGMLLMVGAAFFWALGVVLQKRLRVDLPVASYTAWMALIGGIPVFLLCALFEREALAGLHGVSLWPALGVLFNMFLVFIFGWWAWTKIVASVPAGVAGLSSLFIPVVGVASGMIFLAEVPAWQDWAALALVSAAIATVLIPGRSAGNAPAPASR